MLEFFDEKAIGELKNKKQTAPSGFHYGFTENIFKEDVYQKLTNTFPDIKSFKLVDKMSGGGHKRFYVGPDYYSGKDWGCICHMKNLPEIWQKVLLESAAPEFIEMLSTATGIKFNSLCNFGFAYGNEGCVQEPHIDGAARPDDPSPVHSTIACLLYLNQKPDGFTGTCIYAPDRKTIIFQVPNLRNSMSFFKQHPSAWHGFPQVPKGESRRIISLSYSQEAAPIALKTFKEHNPLPYLGDRRILQCGSCGIVFLSPEISMKDSESYYREGDYWRDKLNDPLQREMLSRNARAMLSLITLHKKPDKSVKLLDIGSHEGTFVEEALKFGYQAQGIEPNKRIAAEARARGLPITEGAIESLAGEEKFDIITLFHVLEHLPDPQLALEKIKNHLKTDGILALEIPNIESYLAKRHGLSWKFIALEHLWYFSPLTLKHLLKEAGFEITFSLKRNGEIPYLSLGDIRQYFRPNPNYYKDRFKMKVSAPAAGLLKIRFKLLKRFLAAIIYILGRADHFFVIAKKIL